jgi:hypothetical protein
LDTFISRTVVGIVALSLKNQSTTLSQSNREAPNEKRLNNLLGDILRSKDLTTEPQKHIDRLYTQASEAIGIYDKLDSETRKKFDMGYTNRLYRKLGRLTVEVKNSMTSPLDFYFVIENFVHDKNDENLLKIMEFNRNGDGRRRRQSKDLIDRILYYMGGGDTIEQVIQCAEDECQRTDLVPPPCIHVFQRAVEKSGVTQRRYIGRAIEQRLKADGFIDFCKEHHSPIAVDPKDHNWCYCPPCALKDVM